MKNPSIKKNYLLNMLNQILTMLLPLITTPYASRIFGAEMIGVQSYTNSLVTYFTIIAALGTQTYGQREIAYHRTDRQKLSDTFWGIEAISIVSGAICLGAWALVISFSDVYRIYYCILSLNIVTTMLDITWLYAGLERYQGIVIRNVAIKLVGVIVLFGFIKKPTDLYLYMLLISLFNLFGSMSMWTYLPQIVNFINFKRLNLLAHFKETIVYFLPAVAVSLYTVLDKSMIGYFCINKSENGYYEQTNKIINIVRTALLSLTTVMSSRVSYLIGIGKQEEAKARMMQVLDVVFLLGFPIMFGLVAISGDFIPIFLGKGYEPAGKLLVLSSPLIIIVAISNCYGNLYYTPYGKRKVGNKAIFLGAFLNVAMNLILIPRIGAMGAVISSLMAELLIDYLYIKWTNGYIKYIELFRSMYKRFIAALIMYSVILFVSKIQLSQIMCIILKIILGVVVYFTVLLVLRDSFLVKYLPHKESEKK